MFVELTPLNSGYPADAKVSYNTDMWRQFRPMNNGQNTCVLVEGGRFDNGDRRLYEVYIAEPYETVCKMIKPVKVWHTRS